VQGGHDDLPQAWAPLYIGAAGNAPPFVCMQASETGGIRA
jgi:hypothetical protein